jgi:hypothetical protein
MQRKPSTDLPFNKTVSPLNSPSSSRRLGFTATTLLSLLQIMKEAMSEMGIPLIQNDVRENLHAQKKKNRACLIINSRVPCYSDEKILPGNCSMHIYSWRMACSSGSSRGMRIAKYLEGSCTSRRFGEIIFFTAPLSASFPASIWSPLRPPPLNLSVDSPIPDGDCL